MTERVLTTAAILLALSTTSLLAQDAELDMPRPMPGEFVRDLADLISPDHEQQITSLAQKLLEERNTPLFVLTLDSMARHGGRGLRLEQFADQLVRQWRGQAAQPGDRTWQKRLILIISRDDRRAWIEYSEHYLEKRGMIYDVLQHYLVVSFNEGRYSDGVLLAVQSLDAMDRDADLPRRPVSLLAYLPYLLLLVLACLTAASFVQSGRRGIGYRLCRAVFALPGRLLQQAVGEVDDGIATAVASIHHKTPKPNPVSQPHEPADHPSGGEPSPQPANEVPTTSDPSADAPDTPDEQARNV